MSARPQLHYLQVTDFVPISSTLRSDCGTVTGDSHTHRGLLRTCSTSAAPSHSTTRLASTFSEAAHFKKTSKSPKARAKRKSTGAISPPSSSYRLTDTFAPGIPNARMTSAKKVAFFIFDSTRTICESG